MESNMNTCHWMNEFGLPVFMKTGNRSAVAAALDRPPSSVSRELKRNSGLQVGYKPSYAQEQAAARRWSGSRLERDAELRRLVLDRLPKTAAGRPNRSPAGWPTTKAATSISHESIYRFVCPDPRTNGGSGGASSQGQSQPRLARP